MKTLEQCDMYYQLFNITTTLKNGKLVQAKEKSVK